MIFFTCQNGHRLHSQTLQPGQWIRCPRCGIVTQIPEQSTISTPISSETTDMATPKIPLPTISAALSTELDSVSSSSGTSPSELSSSGSQRLPDVSQSVPWTEAEVTDGTSSSTEESTDVPFSTLPISQTETPLDAASNTPCEPEWEFLCPNGHLLHSTQAFQGRLGECPECHSRFRIPTLVPPTNPTDATDSSNASTSSTATKVTGNGMGNGTGNAFGGHRIGSSGSPGNASNLGNTGTGNLAGLNIEKFGESFTRLWELHRRLPILLELEQGRRVVVSEFHADLSDDVLGVFTGYVQSSSAQTSEAASDTSNHSTPEKPETLAIPWYSIVLMRFANELETF